MGGKTEGGVNIGATLERMAEQLQRVSDTPTLDSQVLLARRMNRTRAWILAHPDIELDAPIVTSLDDDMNRLETGVPLPYVLGEWEFFGTDFIVTPAVLIPRPETELLVERALGWLQRHKGRCLGLDVGTGSGCIAISLLLGHPDLLMIASDISPDALVVARLNAARAAVLDRMHLTEADLIPGDIGPQSIDLLCANLPYVPRPILSGLPVVAHEPPIALNGGEDGLTLIRRLLDAAPKVMAPHGLVLLEIEAGQGVIAGSLARNAFPMADVQILQDLSGHDRLVEINLSTKDC